MTWGCLIGMAKAGFRFLKENHTAFPLAVNVKQSFKKTTRQYF